MTKVLTQNDGVTDRIIKASHKNEHSFFWLMIAGFMGLIFIRNLFFDFPVIILLAYICIVASFSDHDEIMALAVSFIPFSAAFQYRYALLFLIVAYLIKYPKNVNRINVSAYIPLGLMMAWELLHGIFYDFSFVKYLQGFSELIFCTFVISLPNKKFDYKFISRVLSISTAFACAIVLIKVLQITGYDFATVFLNGNYRLGINDHTETSYVMNYNANSLGLMCNLGICALLLRIKICRINIIDIGLIIALAFFGFLTLSRTFVLCLAMIAFMYVFSIGTNLVKTARTVVLFLILVVVILFAIYTSVPYVFENIVERFNEDDVTNGRGDLFAYYNDHIFSSLKYFFFGIGIHNILSKMGAIYIDAPFDVPHNAFQEIIVGWGIVGLIIFLSFIYIMIIIAKRSVRKIRLSNFLPFVLVIVASQAGQLITSGFRLISLVFVFITMCTDFVYVRETLNAAKKISNGQRLS